MGSRKTQFLKLRLGAALRKNKNIPNWKHELPGFKQKWNIKKRSWRRKRLHINC